MHVPLKTSQGSVSNVQSQTTKLAPTCNRRLFSVAVPLLFLPWRGCSQGGFYDTGVSGTVGKDCQPIYQPAAAAEERYKSKNQPPKEEEVKPVTPASTLSDSNSDLDDLRLEQKAFDRLALDAEKAARTKEFVDNMWQSLE